MSAVAAPSVVASVVHIRIRRRPRLRMELEPSKRIPVPLFFSYPHHTPSDYKPHFIVWEVFGLHTGERLEIRLRDLPPFHLAPIAKHVSRTRLLRALFPTATRLRPGRYGWVVSATRDIVESGPAHSPYGRFEFAGPVKYDVVFFDALGNEHPLDPDVDVTPDP